MKASSESRMVIMQADLGPAAKLLAIRILDVQGRREGACKLPVRQLAEDCGMPLETARRAMKELTRKGWVEADRRSNNRAWRRLVHRVADDPQESPQGVTGDPVTDDPRVTGDPVGGHERPARGSLVTRTYERGERGEREDPREGAREGSFREDLDSVLSAAQRSLTRSGKVWESAVSYLDRDLGPVVEVVQAMAAKDPRPLDELAADLAESWVSDPATRKLSAGSFANYIRARANGRKGWGGKKPSAWTRPAAAEAFEGGDSRADVDSFTNPEVAHAVG